MTIIQKIQHPDGSETVKALNLGDLMFKAHFWAYRALCRKIQSAASTIFTHLIEPPLSAGINQARKVTVVDYCYTSSMRMLNAVSFVLVQNEVVSTEKTKTLKQIERERQIALYQEKLGSDTIYPQFCHVTAEYINAIIPKLIAEKLSALPSFGESWALYRLGFAIRYLNHQIDKRLEYRNALITSLFGKKVQGAFNGLRSKAGHFLVGKHNLEPLLSFEHLLLSLCVKLTDSEGGGIKSHDLIKAAINSLGKSLLEEDEIETFLQDQSCNSDEEALITRLEWHRQTNSLPKGVPNPSHVRLNSSNVREELDKALTERVNELVRSAIEKSAPKTLKSGFLGILYWLEGKDFLVNLLGYLISEFGIKQLIDPHQFAIAILNAGGEETSDFELEGFGRDQRETIAHIGQEMMKEALSDHGNWESIQRIFQRSQLRAAPEGYEGLIQKKEAKKRLREYISSLLYQMIKGNSLQYDTLLKGVRERASKLPIVGTAALTLHGLINGAFFSFGYLFRESDQSDTSFLSWMAKNFTGKEQCRYLADKIVDLIYHPCWRFTLLQVIDAVEDVVLNPPPLRAPSDSPYDGIDLTPITHFIFQHFVRDSELPFEGNIVPLIHYFTSEGLMNQFQQLLRPSEDSLLEKVLTECLPSIKELMLYCRVLVCFRNEKVWFDGDQKFWEFFVRESLNRLTASYVMEKKGPDAKLPQSKIFAVRNRFVELMLQMEDQELKSYLSDIPETSSFLHYWEFLEKDNAPQVTWMQPEYEGTTPVIVNDYGYRSEIPEDSLFFHQKKEKAPQVRWNPSKNEETTSLIIDDYRG